MKGVWLLQLILAITLILTVVAASKGPRKPTPTTKPPKVTTEVPEVENESSDDDSNETEDRKAQQKPGPAAVPHEVNISIPEVESASEIETSDNETNETETRMVGGSNVYQYSQTNYVCGLYIDNAEWCGGAVVTSTRVITAAHCLYQKNSLVLYCGYVSLSNPPSNAVSMSISKNNFIIHPNFDSYYLKNDIGVIKLPQQLSFSSNVIQPIPVMTASDANSVSLESGSSMLCGWGVTSDSSSSLSDYMQYIVVPLISFNKCYNYFPDVLTSTNICTQPSDGSMKGGCKGDSGGPLVANVNGVVKLIGILSFQSTKGCSTSDPRGYTKVSAYTSWLCQSCQVC